MTNVLVRKKTIYKYAMIVEDERDLCHLLGVVLKKNDVPSTCVYSIREARDSIKRIKPSIIFLDNHLPDGAGADFIEQAKAIYPGTKIIMITAHDSPSDISEAFDRGADFFISKPFNSSTIKTTLDFFNTQRKWRYLFSFSLVEQFPQNIFYF
ncbi:MAG: response regulator [Ginsengibacter sp.]